MSNNFYCNRCGRVNIYGQGQCINCGQQFYYNCPQCGAYVNNTNVNCPNCRASLSWPGQETMLPHQTGYKEYESRKGMNPVLKGALIFAGIIIVFAAALFSINSLRKPTSNSSAAQTDNGTQSSQSAQTAQQVPSSQNSQSAQPGPPQPVANSPAYNPADNEVDSGH